MKNEARGHKSEAGIQTRKPIFSFLLSAFCFLVCASAYAQTPASYTAPFIVTCGAAGDCVTFFPAAGGSASILEVWISNNTGAALSVAITMRSAADTGGTSSAITPTLHDASQNAATSTVLKYTVAPTAGTSAGDIVPLQPLTGGQVMVQDFRSRNERPLTLRGATNGVTIRVSAGGAISGYVRWTEPAN